MDSLSSSTSTVPKIDDYFGHNMWNSEFELIFLEQVNSVIVLYFEEVDLSMIAPSFHLNLDLLCYKESEKESA